MIEEAPCAVVRSVATIANRPDMADASRTRAALSRSVMIIAAGRLFRDGLECVLQRGQWLNLATCATLDQAYSALAADQPPDLFVLSTGPTESASLALSRIGEMRCRAPDARWIVLTQRVTRDFLQAAVLAGVEGVLQEDSPGEFLQLLAELVLLGHSFVQSEMATFIGASDQFRPLAQRSIPEPLRPPVLQFEDVARPGRQPGNSGPDASRQRRGRLSEREHEILQCLAGGHPNKLIARELHIAEATVKVHVKALLRKMQVTNRTQAALLAAHYLSPPIAHDNVLTLPHVGRDGCTMIAAEGHEPPRHATAR